MRNHDWAKKHSTKAKQLAAEKKFYAAIREFETAIQIYPDPGTHADFAAALWGAGKYHECVEQYRKVIEPDPGHPLNLASLVEALKRDVHQKDDVQQFHAVIQKADRSELFLDWAFVLAELENRNDAIEEVKKALIKDPEL